MRYDKTNLESFGVKGKEIVTSNKENKFGEMWSEFFKTYSGGQPIAVYTDYESDANGKFGFMIGIKTDKFLGDRVFDGGNYVRFHLDDTNKVSECWQYVWSNDLHRAYTADFEFYNEDGSVDVYIAIEY